MYSSFILVSQPSQLCACNAEKLGGLWNEATVHIYYSLADSLAVANVWGFQYIVYLSPTGLGYV